MNEQCPNIIIYQVCNGETNNLSIYLANPSFATSGYIIFYITIRDQGRIRQLILFYKVSDNLYLINIFYFRNTDIHFINFEKNIEMKKSILSSQVIHK